MKLKLSVFWDHLTEAARQRSLPLPEVLREVRGLGIGWVEINLDTLRADPEGTMALLREADLRVSCVYAFHDWGNTGDLTSAREHVQAALDCGALSVMPIPGQLPPETAEELWRHSGSQAELFAWLDASPEVRRMVEGMKRTIALADGRLKVFLEDFDQRTAPYACTGGLKYFLDRAEGLKLAFDCGNFAYMDEDVLEAWRKIGDRTAHIHLKDRGAEPGHEGCAYNRGLAPVAVGGGYLPIDRILRSLPDSGILCAIEHFGHPDQLQAIRDSVRYLNALA